VVLMGAWEHSCYWEGLICWQETPLLRSGWFYLTSMTVETMIRASDEGRDVIARDDVL
jgi:hypothetical protein